MKDDIREEPQPDAQTDDQDIRDTDILFECPRCGKSMVIDYRGAGLTIPCVDCAHPVDVPIPEGMDVTDLDSSPVDQGVQVIQMRGLLADAQQKILSLEGVVEKLRNDLEGARRKASETGRQLREIQWEMDAIKQAVDKMTQVLQRNRETGNDATTT